MLLIVTLHCLPGTGLAKRDLGGMGGEVLDLGVRKLTLNAASPTALLITRFKLPLNKLFLLYK